jgi:hypothetical protein
MPQYLCLDGPLSGHVLEWRDPPVDGQTLTVGVVDVDTGDAASREPPEADYVVDRPAASLEPGTLRYLARRGDWRSSGVADDAV